MENLVNNTKKIYSQLQDDVSRSIFDNRILYMLTQYYEYIDRIIWSLPQRQELDKAVEKCRQLRDKVVIWGAGNDLLILKDLYPDLDIQYLCDKNKKLQEEGWNGIPVLSPEELVQRKSEIYVAINTSAFHEEIYQYLLENGFDENKIIDMGKITYSLCSSQYFEKNIMESPCDGGIFVDGGCFDCSTDREFIRWCSGNYQKIYAFEPDAENYEKCLEKSRKEQIKNIELYNKGLWNDEVELSFEQTGGQGSKIGSEGNKEDLVTISTISLDAVLTEREVSMIKLDVEGAELKALQGAEKTILQCRPKLAVCIYHKPEDIVEIPAYLLSLHSDYKFYIRHYQMSANETVLYAI